MPLRPRARFLVAPVLIALAIASLASGCASTFQYRALQSRFMEAAQADNQAAVDPLSASTADTAYAPIAAELTPERIAELDPKLRANAWVIRSYSLWRSARYQDAIASAGTGLKTDGLGPRDRILLLLLPALAVDSEQRDLWVAKNRTLTGADYPPFQQAFSLVYGELGKASADVSSAPSTMYYVEYQRWRILNDWNIVLGSIDKDDSDSPARREARALAEKVVGSQLTDAADAARKKIPDGHPLRQLIEAQSRLQ